MAGLEPGCLTQILGRWVQHGPATVLDVSPMGCNNDLFSVSCLGCIPSQWQDDPEWRDLEQDRLKKWFLLRGCHATGCGSTGCRLSSQDCSCSSRNHHSFPWMLGAGRWGDSPKARKQECQALGCVFGRQVTGLLSYPSSFSFPSAHQLHVGVGAQGEGSICASETPDWERGEAGHPSGQRHWGTVWNQRLGQLQGSI